MCNRRCPMRLWLYVSRYMFFSTDVLRDSAEKRRLNISVNACLVYVCLWLRDVDRRFSRNGVMKLAGPSFICDGFVSPGCWLRRY